MKKYIVNVVYFYPTTIEVEAHNKEEAKGKALVMTKEEIDNDPTSDMDAMEFAKFCITDVKETK